MSGIDPNLLQDRYKNIEHYEKALSILEIATTTDKRVLISDEGEVKIATLWERFTETINGWLNRWGFNGYIDHTSKNWINKSICSLESFRQQQVQTNPSWNDSRLLAKIQSIAGYYGIEILKVNESAPKDPASGSEALAETQVATYQVAKNALVVSVQSVEPTIQLVAANPSREQLKETESLKSVIAVFPPEKEAEISEHHAGIREPHSVQPPSIRRVTKVDQGTRFNLLKIVGVIATAVVAAWGGYTAFNSTYTNRPIRGEGAGNLDNNKLNSFEESQIKGQQIIELQQQNASLGPETVELESLILSQSNSSTYNISSENDSNSQNNVETLAKATTTSTPEIERESPRMLSSTELDEAALTNARKLLKEGRHAEALAIVEGIHNPYIKREAVATFAYDSWETALQAASFLPVDKRENPYPWPIFISAMRKQHSYEQIFTLVHDKVPAHLKDDFFMVFVMKFFEHRKVSTEFGHSEDIVLKPNEVKPFTDDDIALMRNALTFVTDQKKTYERNFSIVKEQPGWMPIVMNSFHTIIEGLVEQLSREHKHIDQLLSIAMLLSDVEKRDKELYKLLHKNLLDNIVGMDDNKVSELYGLVVNKASCAPVMIDYVSGVEDSVIDMLKLIESDESRIFNIEKVLKYYPHVSVDKLWEVIPKPGFPDLLSEAGHGRLIMIDEEMLMEFLCRFVDNGIETGNLALAEKAANALVCDKVSKKELCMKKKQDADAMIKKAKADKP